jgi:hypothetical protein
MPKKASFNFGVNKAKKPRTSRSSKKGRTGRGSKSNAWRAYTRASNAPIPD